jgi:hypothetical protein
MEKLSLEKILEEEAPDLDRLIILETINPINSDKTQFRYIFEKNFYDMEMPMQSTETFSKWLNDYASKTPRCACCNRIIFPWQPVAGGHLKPKDSGASHISEECSHDTDKYVGSFNDDGEFIPLNLSRFINKTEK